MIHLTHKIELDPNQTQEIYFRRSCGTARFAYNWALDQWKRQYEAGGKPTSYSIRKQWDQIKYEDYPWALEVSKTCGQYAIMNLGAAYDKFFKKQGKYPKFKKRGFHDSYQMSNGAPKGQPAVKLDKNKLWVPRLGWVRLKEFFRFNGRIIKAVVSRTAHKWFVSLTCELDLNPPNRDENQAQVVGVDLGSRKLATLSDGVVFENPRALEKKLKRLRRLSQSLSRKQKGSNNSRKAKERLARLHYRVACIRHWHLHDLTTFLVRNYDVIVIEDLNVKGMVRNRHLARCLSDASFGEIRRQLEYKCKMNGVELVVADRFYPSSKTCSVCGTVNKELKGQERWRCPFCGTTHDRDDNASINLKQLADKSSVTACGEGSSGPPFWTTKLPSAKQETFWR